MKVVKHAADRLAYYKWLVISAQGRPSRVEVEVVGDQRLYIDAITGAVPLSVKEPNSDFQVGECN